MSLKKAMKLHLLAHCMVARNMKESIVCILAWNRCIGTNWRDSIRGKLNSVACCVIKILFRNVSNAFVAVRPAGITLNAS
jgi:hypothetical protein